MTALLNPHLIQPAYTSIKDLRTMRKTYAPSYSIGGRTVKAKQTRFRSATAALAYADAFLLRWRERYDKRVNAAVVEVRP